MSRLVADSSPLITMAAAGYLPLLEQIADEVCVPEQVWEECVVQGSGRPGAAEIAQAPMIRVLQVVDLAYLQRLHGEIDLGESAAIALAKELATPVLMDERRGRAVARRESVAVVGTIGILLECKGRGILPAVAPAAQNLIAAGWRVSSQLLQHLLDMAGESGP